MDTSLTRDSWKKEIVQSPLKKFKESSVTKYDFNEVIANGLKLALQEQQEKSLNAIVALAVREAMDSVSVPALHDLCTELQKANEVVNDVSGEIERVATMAKCTQDRVDSVQAAA